jgi:hypothetical protein
MRLNSKFDVLRGWPREGALDETFPIFQTTPGTDDALVPGMVCEVDATTGGLKASTTPNRTSADAKATWVLVEANDDFSGQFVHKAVGLRANAMFRLDPANLAAGTYTPRREAQLQRGQVEARCHHRTSHRRGHQR